MSHCNTFDEKPRRSADKLLLPYWYFVFFLYWGRAEGTENKQQ